MDDKGQLLLAGGNERRFLEASWMPFGWASHHSIVQFRNKWYLFYHDSSLSKGVTHLRCIKVTGLTYEENGYIKTIQPYQDLKILM